LITVRSVKGIHWVEEIHETVEISNTLSDDVINFEEDGEGFGIE
jgi:hypothetical protein